MATISVLLQKGSNGTPITSATDTTLVAAPGANTHLRVYSIQATNSSATATFVYWRDGASGEKRFPASLGQNGTFSRTIKDGWDLTSNTALVVTTSGAGNVEWHVEYKVVPD